MVASRWWSEAEGCNLKSRTCAQSLQRSHFNRSLRDIIPPAGGFRVSSIPQTVVAHASTAAARCHRYSVPSAQTRCMSTASLRATAMTAQRRPRRFAMPSPQTRMAEYLLDRVRSARADWYRTARIAASPHLEMPPFLSVSPEAYFFGVRPR
jgi:hypothetical protein